jgi:uncharacterized membrane protein
MKMPKALDAMVKVVLTYRPPAKSNAAVQRKRRATKLRKAGQK